MQFLFLFHLVLCGGGREGDLLSEYMMGLQADVTETSENQIPATAQIYYFLSQRYCMRLNPLDAE